MTRPRPRIGSELLPLFLILLCLGGTLALVLEMYRRGAAARRIKEPPKVAAAPVLPAPPPDPAPEPVAPPPPAPPPEDPTQKALGQLRSAEAVERDEAAKAERRAESLAAARRSALAESQRWRRRETVIRGQVADLADKAENLELERRALAMERDALARERDTAKAALAKARTSSSYAIVPHKGTNGTWRRPIVIECRNGAAILQPEGAAFGMLDLSSLSGLRSSPFVRAVARELVRIGASSTPDGGVNVPYIFFVIRPDGIRPYYEARARLEMLGIAFGYELVDQSWEIDYTALENPIDGNPASPGPASSAPAVADREELSWPGEQPKPKRATEESPDSFVWHSRPTGAPDGQNRLGGGSGSRRAPLSASPGAGGDSGLPGGTGSGILGELANSGGGAADRGAGGRTGAGNAATAGGAASERGSSADMPPLGVAGGQSATERAFGTPGSITPLSPSGMPAFEATDGGGGAGTPGGLLAQNGGATPSGGAPIRGRAGVGVRGGSPEKGSQPLAGLDGDDVPEDGRVPVVPRSYFDEKDDKAQASADGPTAGAETADRGAGAAGSSGQTAGASGALNVADTQRSPGATGASSDSTDNARAGSAAPSGASPGTVQMPIGGGDGAGEARPIKKRASAPESPHLRIEVPFEMTIVCSPTGVMIHPGGYRLSPTSLKAKGDMLIKELNAVLQRRREVDPLIVPRPRLKFLIAPGGADTYETARRQTSLAGLAWPTTIQIGDTSVISFSGVEGRR